MVRTRKLTKKNIIPDTFQNLNCPGINSEGLNGYLTTALSWISAAAEPMRPSIYSQSNGNGSGKNHMKKGFDGLKR